MVYKVQLGKCMYETVEVRFSKLWHYCSSFHFFNKTLARDASHKKEKIQKR